MLIYEHIVKDQLLHRHHNDPQRPGRVPCTIEMSETWNTPMSSTYNTLAVWSHLDQACQTGRPVCLSDRQTSMPVSPDNLRAEGVRSRSNATVSHQISAFQAETIISIRLSTSSINLFTSYFFVRPPVCLHVFIRLRFWRHYSIHTI